MSIKQCNKPLNVHLLVSNLKAFITIIAAPGGFQRVRSRIQNLSLGEKARIGNCHDVTGLCDVIAEVFYEGTLREFFEEVINEITKLQEVNKVTTYPVYRHSVARTTQEPVRGYIFIGALPKQVVFVQEELSKLEEIVSTNVVAGEYDIIAVTTNPLQEMTKFARRMQDISGIKWSRTCIPHDVFRTLKEMPQVYSSSVSPGKSG